MDLRALQQHDLIDPRDRTQPDARAPLRDAPVTSGTTVGSDAVADAPQTAASPAPAPEIPPVTLFVCTTCKATDAAPDAAPAGSDLFDAVQALSTGDATLDQVAVHPVKCLGNCKHGLSAALIRRDGWTYVFGDLVPTSAEDLLTGARLFLTSTDGILPWRGRPDVLKRNMVARVPPLAVSPPAS